MKKNPKASEKITVLYVDSDVNNLKTFKGNYSKRFEVFIASSIDEGLEVLSKNEVHVIITNQKMPRVSGVKVFEAIMKKYPDPVRILLTGHPDMEAVINAVNKTHIFKYVSKPWKDADMIASIEEAYKTYRSKSAQKQTISKLTQVNEQLEFMLREKLIS